MCESNIKIISNLLTNDHLTHEDLVMAKMYLEVNGEDRLANSIDNVIDQFESGNTDEVWSMLSRILLFQKEKQRV